MSPWKDSVGYSMIALKKNKKKYWRRVHRLVAVTFIPNPENKPQVNHKDGNKLNNNIDNLEWMTNKENSIHAYESGLNIKGKGGVGRGIKILVYDKSNNFIKEFKSITDTAKSLKLNRKTLTSILWEEKNNNYPYNFEFKNPLENSRKSITTTENIE